MSPDDIRELFSAFGNVTVRRLFGGAGLYLEATMFALMHDGVIYLKTDAHNAEAFERENLPPFTYATKAGKRGVMSYRRMPERLYDDPEELAVWAREALSAARRGSIRKPARSSSRKAVSKPPKRSFKQPSGRRGAPPNRSRR